MQTRTYVFDEMSRLTSETNPETGTVSYIYDSDPTTCKTTSQGDLIRKTDALSNVTCYVYDPLHRITSITYASGTGPYSSTPAKNFVYDNASVTINGTAIPISYPKKRMVEAFTGTTMLKLTDEAFRYDARGDLTDVYQWSTNSGGTYHLTNTYYWNGSVETLSSNGLNPTLTYDVDTEGRTYAVSASAGQNPLSTVTYNNSSQATAVKYGSGDSDSFSFDPNTGLPTGYTIKIGSGSQVATMTNNPNGSLKTLAVSDTFYSNEDETCQYLYDSDFRLFNTNCGTSGWQGTYTYDQYGNIDKSGSTAFAPTYNTGTNRYSSIPGGTVSYDGNGNLTSDTFHTYAWDADGNPTTIDTYSFNYDAFDRRVEYGTGSSWSQYVYSPSSPGAIVGTATAQTLALRVPMPGGGQAIVTSAGVNNYRRPNWQGSEVMASSPTQAILGDAAFTPFGEHYNMDLSGYDGYFAGNLSISPVFMDGYAGTWRLYHYDQGRWVSPDPAGLSAADPTNPQSWNRYAYVLNNPLSGMDTSGLDGNCTTYSGVSSQGYWITIYCTYYSGVIVINVPVWGPTAGVGQTGGGGNGATMSAGPSSATPWYKNSCITGALASGALNVGIDAIGLIPEAGGATTLARNFGHWGGYRGIVADNFGIKAIQQIKGAAGTVSVTQGLAQQDWISGGLAVAGFIPGLGQVAAVGSIVVDTYKAAKAISQCP